MVTKLGANQVIDYKKDDFTTTEHRFDIILDAVGRISKSTTRHLLKPGGKYVSVTGTPKTAPDDLPVLKGLLESGKLVPVIDRTYTLDQIREAHTYVESFRKKGNVVINVL
jgi:NADPH:quinone reductase-like Zn-dependent oxidoreductase